MKLKQMPEHPIRSDKRYRITQTFCGKPTIQYCLWFCDDFIASSQFYSSLVTRAVGHNSARLGALTITEKNK
jgi:hypothetical protein